MVSGLLVRAMWELQESGALPRSPLVLKQPLARPITTETGTHALSFSDAPCQEVLAERKSTLARLSELKAAGLPIHHAVSLARVATTGDAVYLQQCHPLTEGQMLELDAATPDGTLDLLGVESLEVAEALHRQR